MAILSADLLEVAPKSPAPVATVGNYVVAFNTNSSTTGLVPNGAFAVMDTTTETAKAYSGLTATTSAPAPIGFTAAYGHGGYAWAWLPDGSSLYRIDPATGGVTTFSTGTAFGGTAICCAANGYVCAFASGSNQIKIWNISAGTLATLNTSGMTASSGVAEVGNYIYAQVTISGTSAIRKFDPSGGGSFVAASGAAPANTSGKGVSYGGYVWFQHTTGITRVDPTSFAFTTYSHTSITGGNYSGSSTNLVLGSDNWLYGYGGSDYLIGFNPATGAFGKEALTPARGRRFSLASCNGKLWLPSGEPLT